MSASTHLAPERKGNAFSLQVCRLCGDTSEGQTAASVQWHYTPPGTTTPRCCNHGAWPPPPSLGGRPVQVEEDRPKPPPAPKVESKGGIKVKQACGCRTEVPFPKLCGACRHFLQTHLCLRCFWTGGTADTPPLLKACRCQVTYEVGEGSNAIKASCAYCYTFHPLWDLRDALVGRLGKIKVKTGWDTSGEEGAVETQAWKTIPFTKRVQVCPSCWEDYTLLGRLWRAAGKSGEPYLPL